LPRIKSAGAWSWPQFNVEVRYAWFIRWGIRARISIWHPIKTCTVFVQGAGLDPANQASSSLAVLKGAAVITPEPRTVNKRVCVYYGRSWGTQELPHSIHSVLINNHSHRQNCFTTLPFTLRVLPPATPKSAHN
jgi:hypothetical protein